MNVLGFVEEEHRSCASAGCPEIIAERVWHVPTAMMPRDLCKHVLMIHCALGMARSFAFRCGGSIGERTLVKGRSIVKRYHQHNSIDKLHSQHRSSPVVRLSMKIAGHSNTGIVTIISSRSSRPSHDSCKGIIVTA